MGVKNSQVQPDFRGEREKKAIRPIDARSSESRLIISGL